MNTTTLQTDSLYLQLEDVACHVSELEYLVRTIHDGCEMGVQGSSLVSIAERLTKALGEEMDAVIMAYRNHGMGAQP